MTQATKEEQQLLAVASRLRSIVLADFERAAAPSSRQLLKALGPSTHPLVDKLSDKTVVALALPISRVLEGKQANGFKEHITKVLEAGGSKAGAVTLLKSASTLQVSPNENLTEALNAYKDIRVSFDTLREFI